MRLIKLLFTAIVFFSFMENNCTGHNQGGEQDRIQLGR